MRRRYSPRSVPRRRRSAGGAIGRSPSGVGDGYAARLALRPALARRPRLTPAAPANLEADRRADEAEAFADLVDEKPLVRKMKGRRDVGEADERRRRDA